MLISVFTPIKTLFSVKNKEYERRIQTIFMLLESAFH